MIIVGLTGGIGHGKTTFAADLAAQAPTFATYESSVLITEVANVFRATITEHPSPEDVTAINIWLSALPPILFVHTHTDTDLEAIQLTPNRLASHPEYYEKLLAYLQDMQANPQLAAQVITPENKSQFRPLLQWLGGYLALTIDPGIWYDEIVRRIQAAPAVDLVVVGGIRFPADAERIRSAGGFIVEVRRPNWGDQDSVDLTERERRLITPDKIILNNSTLTDLKLRAQELYQELNATTKRGASLHA